MSDRDFKEGDRLLDIVQSANIGIVVLDRDLTVTVFNRFMQVHSGITEDRARGQSLLTLFAELPEQWLRRRIRSVFELGIPVYTSWEERPYLFRFPLNLPIHHQLELMYQNIMLVPLHGSDGSIERAGLVVYDVTDIATVRRDLETAQLRLLQVSRTDHLTGLWNRGYWQERLQQEWQRMRRANGHAALVMFDIDHFKRINDTYGHPTGDEAIRAVARILRETAREIDICGRYGGEEFAVILPDTPTFGAHRFCERLRKNIERHTLDVGGTAISFTISLGAAPFDPDTGGVDAWIARADTALYSAKSGGRNQTRLFNPQPPAPPLNQPEIRH